MRYEIPEMEIIQLEVRDVIMSSPMTDGDTSTEKEVGGSSSTPDDWT